MLKEDAIPKLHGPRRVPQSLSAKLKRTLDELEEKGVVSKVEKPTELVNSLFIVEKSNGDLRLYLDPRDLNLAVKREPT
jgi:hypothetical protein